MKGLFATLRALGPAGVLLIAILDGAGVPLPGGVDALLVLVAVTDPASAYSAAAMALIGSLIGSLILFYIARKGEEAYLKRHTTSPRTERFRSWFQEYGLVTVFVPALVPIPMPLKLFIICAGVSEVSPVAFMAVLLIARIPRFFALAWLGTQRGEQTIPYLKSHWWQLTLLAVALFAMLYLMIRYLDRRRKLRKLVTG